MPRARGGGGGGGSRQRPSREPHMGRLTDGTTSMTTLVQEILGSLLLPRCPGVCCSLLETQPLSVRARRLCAGTSKGRTHRRQLNVASVLLERRDGRGCRAEREGGGERVHNIVVAWPSFCEMGSSPLMPVEHQAHCPGATQTRHPDARTLWKGCSYGSNSPGCMPGGAGGGTDCKMA